MLKCTLNYENLPEKRSTRTGLADVGDGKKKKPHFCGCLGRTSISLMEERFLSNFL